MRMNITYSNQVMLLSARIHPTAKDIEALNNLITLIHDWDSLSETIIKNGYGPLLHRKLPLLSNAILIPKSVKSKLQQAYFKTLGRNMLLYEVYQKAAIALKANNISLLVLKGAYLAEKLYGDIGLRQFSDIDILIKEEDGEQAQTVLKDIGFSSDDYPMAEFLRNNVGFEHYPQLVYNGVAIELHVRLSRPGERYEILTDNVWENAQIISLNGLEVKVPDLTDVLIHTCVHLHKHFQRGQIQFTGFNDIVNLLDIEADKINWKEISERCELYNCEKIVFKYLLLVSGYYRISLPEYIVNKYTPCLEWADEELFLNYLSGFKGKHYSVQSRFSSIHRLEGVGIRIKYLIWMAFPSKNYMISSYKIKNPRLYWLYYPYRYWIGLKGLWRMMRREAA